MSGERLSKEIRSVYYPSDEKKCEERMPLHFNESDANNCFERAAAKSAAPLKRSVGLQ
jgi:hypothetical protein